MTSHRGRPALTIAPGVSQRLAAFVVLTHLAAALSVASLPWPWPMVLIAVASSLLYQIQVHVLRRARWSIRALHWRTDGTWRIGLVSGAEIQATLLPSTFVSQRLVVLNLSAGNWRRFAIPLLSDSLDGEDLRRLRQRLRLEGARSRDTTLA